MSARVKQPRAPTRGVRQWPRHALVPDARAAGRRPFGEGARAPAPPGDRPVGRRGAPATRARNPASGGRTPGAPARSAAGGRGPRDRRAGARVARCRWEGGASLPTRSGRCCPRARPGTFLPGRGEGATARCFRSGRTPRPAGTDGGPPVAWALHTDRRTHWDPERYSTRGAQGAGFGGARAADPGATACSSSSRPARSSTAASPARTSSTDGTRARSPRRSMCNARCVGCISDQPEDGPPASHERMDDGPERRGDGAGRPSHHLPHAPGRDDGELRPGLRGRAAHPLAGHRRGHPAASARRRTRGSHQHQHQRQPHRRARGAVRRGAGRDPRLAELGGDGPLRGLLPARRVRLGGRGGVDRAVARAAARTWRSTCCSSPASPTARARWRRC